MAIRKYCFKAAVLAGALAIGTAPAPTLAEPFAAEGISLDIEALAGRLDDAPLLITAFEPLSQAPVLPELASIDRSALSTPAGRPQPSIILGMVDPGTEQDFGIESVLPSSLVGAAFAHDDLDRRQALRQDDPELFRRIVEGGFADPPEEFLVSAIQTELSRMNCYRMRIDGLWGRGSIRSVAAYYEALDNGSSWSEQRASFGLFRSILLNGDATCPDPVPVASTPRQRTTTTRRATTRSTQTRTTTRQATRQVQRSTPAAQPTPSAQPTQTRSVRATGAFR